MITLEQLADLSPNMRKVLRDCDYLVGVPYRSTYWITLQGMLCRHLLSRPKEYRGIHPLTDLGKEYKEALLRNK